MKTEQQLRDFLIACSKVRGFGMSKGPCPMEPTGSRCCCAECSTPSAIEWVLGERENGQDALINTLEDEGV